MAEEFVTPRPRTGRVPSSNINTPGRKYEMPKGKKLYCRLIAAFTTASVIGTCFITLGALFFDDAKHNQEEKGMSLPLVWCISGIVGGLILILGSLILAQLILSNYSCKKKRRVENENQQVRYQCPLPGNEQAVVLPPSYEYHRTQGHNVYTVGNSEHYAPPPYSEMDDKPPDYSSLQ